MQSLSNLRLKVTNYYASLINKLDLEAETRIMKVMSKEDTINNRREQFINKIKRPKKGF